MLCVLISVCLASYQELNAQALPKQAERHFYKIDLKIDFDKLSYTGVERVRWVNRGEKPSSVIYFHLYQNLRSGDQPFPFNSPAADADEPRIDILEVRAGANRRRRGQRARGTQCREALRRDSES